MKLLPVVLLSTVLSVHKSSALWWGTNPSGGYALAPPPPQPSYAFQPITFAPPPPLPTLAPWPMFNMPSYVQPQAPSYVQPQGYSVSAQSAKSEISQAVNPREQPPPRI